MQSLFYPYSSTSESYAYVYWRSVGQLTYSGIQEGRLAFEVTDANSFGCAYDLYGSTVLVEPAPNGLEVWTLGWSPGRPGVILPPADASPGASASPGG